MSEDDKSIEAVISLLAVAALTYCEECRRPAKEKFLRAADAAFDFYEKREADRAENENL